MSDRYTVTFFGHRDCPENIIDSLYKTAESLIRTHDNICFYIGNEGKFDSYARKVLQSLSQKYPNITYNVVLAYMPSEKRYGEYMDYSDTLIPDGIEECHPKYAIAKRNGWMAKKADCAITYVKYPIGGAFICSELMKQQGKTVINLADV